MTNKTEPTSETPADTNATKPQKAALSPDVIELVMELRDTVRRINPKRHTPSSLRRNLANVTSILEDISEACGTLKSGTANKADA